MANVHHRNLVPCYLSEHQVGELTHRFEQIQYFRYSANPSPTKTDVSIDPSPPAKGKSNPPISYSKHYNPPCSTTSVIKQLVGGGATLVYDSLTQDKSSPPPHPSTTTTSSLLQHRFYPNHHFQKQRKEHVRFEPMNLTNSNFTNSLTVTPTPSKSNSFIQQKTNSIVSENLNLTFIALFFLRTREKFDESSRCCCSFSGE